MPDYIEPRPEPLDAESKPVAKPDQPKEKGKSTLGNMFQKRPPGQTSIGGGPAKSVQNKPTNSKPNTSQPSSGSTTLASLMGKSDQHQRAQDMMQGAQHKKAEFTAIMGRPAAQSIAIEAPTDSSESSESDTEYPPTTQKKPMSHTNIPVPKGLAKKPDEPAELAAKPEIKQESESKPEIKEVKPDLTVKEVPNVEIKEELKADPEEKAKAKETVVAKVEAAISRESKE